MKNFVLPLVLTALPLVGQTPAKIGTVNLQAAIANTKDGQRAASDLSARYEPRQKELESRRQEIAQLQNDLARGSNTMSAEKSEALRREADAKTKSLNRATEDAQAEFEQDRDRVLNDIGQKLLVVLDKLARDNSYTVVLDVGSPQTPVLFQANGVDVTKELIDLYDKNSPSALAPLKPPAPAPAAKPPAAPPAAAPAKKQPGTVK